MSRHCLDSGAELKNKLTDATKLLEAMVHTVDGMQVRSDVVSASVKMKSVAKLASLVSAWLEHTEPLRIPSFNPVIKDELKVKMETGPAVSDIGEEQAVKAEPQEDGVNVAKPDEQAPEQKSGEGTELTTNEQ